MGWFRAGFLPTVYALEKIFCAREAALKFGGGVEVFFCKIGRPPCPLICSPEGLLESRRDPLA